MKKYRFFLNFHGPELIISNRIQSGIITTISPKGPCFQQKKIRVLRSALAQGKQKKHARLSIFFLWSWTILYILCSVLKTISVVLFMIKISPQNFTNFNAKFGSKVEIRWKLDESRWFFLYNSKVSSYLLGHILLFWKVMMPAI